jgi:hypothetical protein
MDITARKRAVHAKKHYIWNQVYVTKVLVNVLQGATMKKTKKYIYTLCVKLVTIFNDMQYADYKLYFLKIKYLSLLR